MIVQSLSRVTHDSTKLRAPSKLYRTTADWFEKIKRTKTPTDETSVCKTATYETIYPAHEVKLPSSHAYPPALNRFLPSQASLFEAFVTTLPRGRVLGFNVIATDGSLLEDLSPNCDRRFSTLNRPHNQEAMRRFQLPSPTIVSGRVAMMAIPYGWNYFHWICDLLPRFFLLQKSNINIDTIDYFIVNEIQSPFQQRTLDYLNIPSHKLIELPRKGTLKFHLQAQQLIVPSVTTTALLNPHGCIDSWVCNFLREELAPPAVKEAEQSGFKGTEYLYISRAKTGKRRVANEDEVMTHLTRYGFKKVFLEDYTLGEKIILFRNAQAVLSPHGAGLAHLVFCHPGTKIIEFCAPEYLTRNFRDIAYFSELDYRVFAGVSASETVTQPISCNIHVDIPTLENILEHAGIKPV